MTKTLNKEFTAIIIALSITLLLFLSAKTYATSTVKSTVKINGVEYVNDEVVSEGSNDTDIDVSVKNEQGTIKYKVNGEEKVIQITPNSQKSKNSNSVTDDSNDEQNAEEEKNGIENKKNDDKSLAAEKKGAKKEKQEAGNIIEAMIKAINKLFDKLNNFFS